MRLIGYAVLALLFLFKPDCGQSAESVDSPLADARRGFATKLVRKTATGEPTPEPPPHLFRSIKYPSPIGKLAAYVSISPGDGTKHPAIIWIIGGFSNSTGETAWEQSSLDNDQSARAFREVGIVMMYPSLRGGNDNPGFIEGFYGEVDAVIAAADYLKKLDYVDPKRIYLGGHSTGGTLALLVAESTNCFRSIFSFGPVADIRGYGRENLPFDLADSKELELRAPGRWLQAIGNATYVFEGTEQPSNIKGLEALSRTSHNPLLHFHPVKGASHFSVLAPITRLVATKILHDDGATSDIIFSESEFSEALQHK